MKTVIILVQAFFTLGIGIWAITYKVEAEKQKLNALTEKEENIKTQRRVSELEEELKKCKASE